MMTVADLIEVLSDLEPNAEVKIAYQPSYPLQSSVIGVHDESFFLNAEDNGYVKEGTVWIVGSDQTDYASRHLWYQD